MLLQIFFKRFMRHILLVKHRQFYTKLIPSYIRVPLSSFLSNVDPLNPLTVDIQNYTAHLLQGTNL